MKEIPECGSSGIRDVLPEKTGKNLEQILCDEHKWKRELTVVWSDHIIEKIMRCMKCRLTKTVIERKFNEEGDEYMNSIMDLDEKVERLLYEKIYLEKKIKANAEKLKPFIKEMKAFCKEIRLRRFTYGGFEILYSPSKQYFKLLVKTEQVHEVHPDWVEEKTGYERLRITEVGE